MREALAASTEASIAQYPTLRTVKDMHQFAKIMHRLTVLSMSLNCLGHVQLTSL